MQMGPIATAHLRERTYGESLAITFNERDIKVFFICIYIIHIIYILQKSDGKHGDSIC